MFCGEERPTSSYYWTVDVGWLQLEQVLVQATSMHANQQDAVSDRFCLTSCVSVAAQAEPDDARVSVNAQAADERAVATQQAAVPGEPALSCFVGAR